MATTSTRSAIRFALKKARPIRPNPLIATRGFMGTGFRVFCVSGFRRDIL